MRKFALILTVFGFGLAVTTGSILGYKNALKDGAVSLSPSDITRGFFCASFDCTQEGLNGRVSKYDPNLKLITFQLNKKTFDISLNNSTIIDNTNGISYFEKTFKKGDVLEVIFDRLNPRYAAEVYFHKTGSIQQKKLIEDQKLKQQ